jgi:hypothetical protein
LRSRAGIQSDFPKSGSHAMTPRMGDERVEAAITRLERALERVEAAASRQPRQGAPAQTLFDGDEAIEIRARHQALRGKVEGAIAKIDSLIHSAERH